MGDVERFRNAHEGCIGWIIGNGPSVRIPDLEKLTPYVSFGANRLYLAYNRTDFRPRYTVSVDEQMIRDFGHEMVEKNEGPVFLVTNSVGIPQASNCFHLVPKGGTPLRFSTDITNFVTPGGGSLIGAIQIGYYMGIRHFFLYGIDHKFRFTPGTSEDPLESAIGDGNHFIEQYRSGRPWQRPVSWQAESSFLMSHVFLEGRGGFVNNATHGGQLNTLPRVPFEKALEMTRLNHELELRS